LGGDEIASEEIVMIGGPHDGVVIKGQAIFALSRYRFPVFPRARLGLQDDPEPYVLQVDEYEVMYGEWGGFSRDDNGRIRYRYLGRY
jgi:hypothetical protein